MKVLVAEDDRVSRRVLEKYLTKWGYEVLCAADGNEAWEILKTKSCHLAVLDWMMPGLSGVELCTKIRASEKLEHLYILLLSGKTEKQDMVAGLEAGADDYVMKPFDPTELSSRLKVGRRLVESGFLLQKKNQELERYASEMEGLAEERAKMLVHSDRLASLGTLTAGVAHEVNNPTTFISGNVQTLERCWETIEKALNLLVEQNPSDQKKIAMIQEEFPQMLRGIRSGVSRITTIIDGLKKFARVGKNANESFSVNSCIEQALLLVNNRLKYSVKVQTLLIDSLPNIHGDPQKLEQVFVNLFVNAADSMMDSLPPNAGILKVTSKHEANGGVHIIIEDNGAGIPEDKLPEIWKPFFTTKEVGKGTGLGLAISQGIIEDHGGTISVANKAEGGARFSIKIPSEV